MKKHLLHLFLLLLIFMQCTSKNSNLSGNLIIIGGGKRPHSIMQKFVELAGGKQAKVAIIPMASNYYREVGPEYEKEFIDLGVSKATSFYIHSQEEANSDSLINAIAKYTGVFFGGGDQNKLTAIFLKSKMLDFFKEGYSKGLTLGGTSAGAAIMSSIMITGDGNWEVPKKDSVKTARGFGLIDRAVFDQHFFRRKRFNRLVNVVIENNIRGVGIDESTAVWIHDGNQAEVLGNSTVMVIDPGEITMKSTAPGNILSAKKMKLSIYQSGDKFSL